MRPPLPPFIKDTARAKVQAAEDGWNTRAPQKVALAYTENTQWRNRDRFINGREEVIHFLTDKWMHELDYKLKKELWSYTENRIVVKFFYEWRDASNQWHRSYGNELWEFAPDGLMQRREASINAVQILESDRWLK